MTAHVWTSLTFTPLEVTEEANGTLTVEATEAAIEIAVDDTLMGCWFCHKPLTVENFHTECEADQNTAD